ncbi:MAG: signal recognition particle subunit, partial [Mycobacterium sp.]|nr:signal recognition particle subunit [Mycobacterium sp.]
KIVNDELVGILGGETRQLAYAKTPPTVVMLAGLQGSGKTTLAGKLAAWLRGQGHTPLLVACDLQRPAAVDQLQVVGQRAGVPVFAPHPGASPESGPGDPVAVASAGLAEARDKHFDVVIVDTAGRLGIDDELMAQAVAIRDAIDPDEVLFVLDAMIGQDAVNTAQAFGEGVGFTGVVLTKLDGDARGGAALSVREVTGVPILFASSGEKLDDFDVFHPDRMAGRILGMGDVLTLIEQAEQVFDAQQAEEAAAKIGTGELTLEDFLEQMLAIRKMGPIGNLLGMLPGAGQMKEALAEVDDKQLDRLQAIIRGMTPQERADPKIINASRRLRIANGSGVAVSEVNQLVDRFFEARKMMSSMLGGMGIPGMGRKSATRKSKGAKGKKGKKGGRGPTPPKVRNPLMQGMPGMPAGFPDLSQMPEGLNELPPGLADFDLSKLKFPGKK